MAIDASALLSLFTSLLKMGDATDLFCGSQNGSRAERQVADFRFGGGSADLVMRAITGKPYDAKAFEEELVSCGGYKFHLFMKISGEWKKKISGRGVVLYATCHVWGPLCPRCQSPKGFSKIDKFFGDVMECLECGHSFDFVAAPKVHKQLVQGVCEMVPKALGF